MSEPVRLSKRMSELGISSRREADEWIEKGWVKVDGKVVSQLGSKVLPHQKITIEKQASQEQSRRVTILINKPMGYVSGQAEDGYKPAVALISEDTHWKDDPSKEKFRPSQLRSLVPAGRLDIDSSRAACPDTGRPDSQTPDRRELAHRQGISGTREIYQTRTFAG